METKKSEITVLWQASRLTLTGEYVTAPEILCVHGSPIGTLGNFSASIGKAKSKKTFNVSAIVAAALKNGTVLVLENSKNKKTVFTYPKTIYYKIGSVDFHFSSEDKLKAFIAESKILLEVKCVDKYFGSFHCDNKERKLEIKEDSDSTFSFNSQQDVEILFDKSYNFIKGTIVGYARGQLTLMDSGRQELLIGITDLKNSFAGLNTELMIGEDAVSDISIIQKITQCKLEYKKQNLDETNLFDILNQMFREVIRLASQRSIELKRQKTPSYTKELEELKQKREKCNNLMYALERQYHISSVINELSVIRQQEIENEKKRTKITILTPLIYLKFKC